MTVMPSQIHTLHGWWGPNPFRLEGIICRILTEFQMQEWLGLLFHGFLYNFTVSPSILEARSLTSQGRNPSLTWTFDREVKLHWSQSPGEHICPQEGGSDLFTSFSPADPVCPPSSPFLFLSI